MFLRKLYARLIRGCVVALQDWDGEVVIRVATDTPFKTLKCKRMLGTPAALLPGGKVKTPTYTDHWVMLHDYR